MIISQLSLKFIINFYVNFQSDCKDMNRLWQDG